MVIFMCFAYIFSFRSMWKQSVGKFHSDDGKNIKENIWNNKSTSDYLTFMKFECLQFVWHGSFFFVNLYAFAGPKYSTIFIDFKDPYNISLFNQPPKPDGYVAIITMGVVHFTAIVLMAIIFRKGEA